MPRGVKLHHLFGPLFGPQVLGIVSPPQQSPAESNITHTSSSLPPPVGSERFGERNSHQRGEEERGETLSATRMPPHGRTILRAATKPAVPNG